MVVARCDTNSTPANPQDADDGGLDMAIVIWNQNYSGAMGPEGEFLLSDTESEMGYLHLPRGVALAYNLSIYKYSHVASIYRSGEKWKIGKYRELPRLGTAKEKKAALHAHVPEDIHYEDHPEYWRGTVYEEFEDLDFHADGVAAFRPHSQATIIHTTEMVKGKNGWTYRHTTKHDYLNKEYNDEWWKEWKAYCEGNAWVMWLDDHEEFSASYLGEPEDVAANIFDEYYDVDEIIFTDHNSGQAWVEKRPATKTAAPTQ